MTKLVYSHHWYEQYVASGTITIPFEYKSKDAFIYDLLVTSKNFDWSYGVEMSVLGIDLTKDEVNEIESNIRTLEEWFDYNKKEVTWGKE